MQFTDEQQEQIIRAYQSGDGTPRLVARFGGSVHRMIDLLRRNAVTIRPVGSPQRFACNRRYFRTIDTEAKAYWLGMLAADGFIVTGRSAGMSLALASRDHAHVEKFRASIEAEAPVRRYVATANGKRFSCSRLTIVSVEMAADLCALGLTQTKTLRLKPPKLAPHLERHFWRGCVDGDGSLGKYVVNKERPDEKHWRLAFVGTKAMAEGCRAFLGLHCGTRARVSARIGCFHISVQGNRVAPAAIRSLYAGATISLDRKQALADEAMMQATKWTTQPLCCSPNYPSRPPTPEQMEFPTLSRS